MKKVLSVLVALCMVLSLVAGGVPGAAKAAPPATPMDIGTVATAFGQESYTVDQETPLAITNTTTYGDMSGFGANILVDGWIAFDPVLPVALTLRAKGNDVDLGVTYTVPAGAAGFWLSSLVPSGSARPSVNLETGRTEVFQVICDSMPSAFVGQLYTITATTVAATEDGFGDGTDESNWTVLATDSTTVTVNGAAQLVLSGETNPTVLKAGALCSENTNGKAEDNTALDTATASLTPIAITLENTGNATSDAVRIAPVGVTAHVQLWAKDTNGDWWDINISGWMPSAGIALPAGYTGTTNVYIISDQAGTYPMTVKVVKASDSTVVTSASGTLTVIDDAAPALTMGLQATEGENTEPLPVTSSNNYWLNVENPEGATVYQLSFTSGSTLSEPVVTGENGLVPVYLQPTEAQVDPLNDYYTAHNAEGPWRDYLLGTLDGTNPMAYIDATDFTAPVLLDAAQYELNGQEVPMVVVGDFPQGTYELTGELTDVDEGRTTTLSLFLSFTTPLAITTGTVPDGIVGKAYTTTLEATGGVGTHTWALAEDAALPDGLELDPETGEIAGTPTAAGTSTFTVTATDEDETVVDVDLTLDVYAALTVTPQTLPDGVKDTAYPDGAYVATVAGGTESYTYTLKTGDHLPSGLALRSADGLISGTPTATGTFTFTVTVSDSADPAQTANVLCTIHVYAPIAITTTSLPDGWVGTAYSASLAATGGTGHYTWSVLDGPEWLELDTSTGAITGTPLEAGRFEMIFTVTDDAEPANSAEVTLSIQVYETTLSITSTSPLPGGYVNRAYEQPLTAAGGNGTYVWSIASGDLPEGLLLSREEPYDRAPVAENYTPPEIYGTPTTAGTYTFTLKVVSGDQAVLKEFTITITQTYVLTLRVGGNGSVEASPAPVSGNYATGTVVTLTATPDEGYHAVWPENVTPSATNPNVATVTMDDDKTVSVTFAIDTFTLTITTVGEGTVTALPDPNEDDTYDYGTEVTLTAVPATGWHFVCWSDNVTADEEDPLKATVAIEGDTEVTATFAIDTFTLTITTEGEGTVTADPEPTDGKYAYGTTVTLTAVPATGYYVTWTGATPSDDDPNVATVTITDDTEVTATFENTYTLTTTIVGSGTVTADPEPTDGKYAYGTTVTLTAVPATGWHFVGWSDNVTADEEDPLKATLTIEGDTEVTATFAINTYTITVSVANDHGTAVPDKTVYDYGDDAVITLTPEAGWVLNTIMDNDVDVTSQVVGNTYTIANVTANHTVTVTYKVGTYVLTVNVTGSGTVAVSPNQPTYAYGTTVTLTATPATGYSFTGWSGDLTGTTNPATITMTGNKTVTATFAINTYTLNITKVGEGTVTANPEPTDGKYAYGTIVTLTATPATGYSFTGWSGDLTGTTNPATISMTGDKTVTATFAINTYTISVTVTNGTAVPDKASYAYGEAAHVTLTPNTGYVLSTVVDNGADVTGQVAGGVYTIASMTANHTIVVTFVPVAVLPGDVDGDGHVTMLDALMAARAAVGITSLTGTAFTAADVNHDGFITMLDVLLIARMAVGIPG